jgi:hypothetical protein
MPKYLATLASDPFLKPHAPVYCFGSGCPAYEVKEPERSWQFRPASRR